MAIVKATADDLGIGSELVSGEVVVSLATNLADRTLIVGTSVGCCDVIDYASHVRPGQILYLYIADW